MLIRILDAFFNRRLNFFWKLDFEEIKITFQSEKSISIFKDRTDSFDEDEHGDDEGETKGSVSIRSKGFGKDDDIHKVEPNVPSGALSFIARNFPVDRMGQNRWRDYETGRVVSTDEILSKFDHMLPDRYIKYNIIPDWLSQAIGSVDTHLIETQRLLSLETDDYSRFHSRIKRNHPTSVVETDAEDLAERIGVILTDYANEAQKLDESFPKRIMDVFSSNSNTDNIEKFDEDEQQIRNRLEELRQKRDELINVGLIGETVNKPIEPSNIFQENVLIKFLSVYIEDTQKKLGVFKEIYEKMELFQQIINTHFSFKRIEFNKQNGILVRDQGTKEKIPLSELSSGEQHELVLIYGLLFKVKSGSLILIDEPELSLHVAWQKKFISDIQDIQKVKNITFVIATHSPQIINEKWNFVQELAD